MDSWLAALMIEKDSVGLIMLDVELLKACSVTQYNSIKQVRDFNNVVSKTVPERF